MKPSEVLREAKELWESGRSPAGATYAIHLATRDDWSSETAHARITAEDYLKEAALQEQTILRLAFDRAIALAEQEEE